MEPLKNPKLANPVRPPQGGYQIIDSKIYRNLVQDLVPQLNQLGTNRVTFKNEIHRDSKFAICHYQIDGSNGRYSLDYDREQSITTSNQKKTNTDPEILNTPSIQLNLIQFLTDIDDPNVIRAEVKLIQTAVFPFEFNPHRDSQFRRLRNITYLATVIVSVGGIDGGNMRLFQSDNDKLGPFHMIEELPAEAGVGYVVDERPQTIFHGMKTAVKRDESAHRGALLIRFFNTPIGACPTIAYD